VFLLSRLSKNAYICMPKQIIMEKLFAKSLQKINNTSLSFTRSIVDEIYWDDKLIGIKGQRGVGKTTLLLQYLKRNRL